MNKPESSVDELHARIMNLPPRGPKGTIHTDDYLTGHRHARHAAAELVLAASPQAVPSEQPIAEQPQSEQQDSVYLGSAGPSEDLQTALPEDTRDAFEQWAEHEGYPTNKVPYATCAMGLPVYADTRTHAAWWAYQTAVKARGEPVAGPLSGARSDLPSMPPPAASLPVSAPAGQEDARDAKRYRALRQQGGPGAKLFVRGAWSGYLGDYRHLIGEELDAAIDAMSATTKEN